MNTPDFLLILVEPPGNLLYFLVVIAIGQATFLIALDQRLRGEQEHGAGCYSLAALGNVLAWVALMLGSLATIVFRLPGGAILPPLERAAGAWTIVLAAWGFLAADRAFTHKRAFNLLTAALLAALMAGYGWTALNWFPQASAADFNATPAALIWTVIPAVLAVLGGLLMLIRLRALQDAPLKLIYFGIVLAGHITALLEWSQGTPEGSVAGAVRLGFLTAMPFFMAVVYRHIVRRLTAISIVEKAPRAQKPDEAVKKPVGTVPAESRPTDRRIAGRALRRAFELMLPPTVENAPVHMARSIAEALRADIIVILSLNHEGWADVLAAYDIVLKRAIPGLSLKLDVQPLIREAIETGEPRVLTGQEHLADFYSRLDIDQSGPVYVLPMMGKGGVTEGLLVAGMPYTQRELQPLERDLLTDLGALSGRLLKLIRSASEPVAYEAEEGEGTSAARNELETNLEIARGQIREMTQRVRELQIELDYERGRRLEEAGDDALSISQQLERLNNDRLAVEGERERLAQALQDAQATLATASGEDNAAIYRQMIETLQREKDLMEQQKVMLEAQLAELRLSEDEDLDKMLSDMQQQSAQIEAERDRLKGQLQGVQHELREMGIENGIKGLAQTVGKLHYQRTRLQAKLRAVIQERDRLKEQVIAYGAGRESAPADPESVVAELQSELARLAADREALAAQRDQLRAERERLMTELETHRGSEDSTAGDDLRAQLADIIDQRDKLNEVVESLWRERSELIAARDSLKADKTALETERNQLRARYEGDLEHLQGLGVEGIDALKEMINDLTSERIALENRLIDTQHTLSERESELRETLERVESGETAIRANMREVHWLTTEIRTPITSISGYAEMLLSESVGIIGELQRKFLERIKANTARLITLVNDMVDLTLAEVPPTADGHEHGPEVHQEEADVIAVIEDAIKESGPQFREKNITLQMNMQESLPPAHTNHADLARIVAQLLGKACEASPEDGSITLTVKEIDGEEIVTEKGVLSGEGPYLFISVRNSAGKLSRNNGIAAAEKFIAAQGGEFWMDDGEAGGTYQILLPFKRA